MSLPETSLTCIQRYWVAARLADCTLKVLERDGFAHDLTGLRVAVLINCMGSIVESNKETPTSF